MAFDELRRRVNREVRAVFEGLLEIGRQERIVHRDPSPDTAGDVRNRL